MKQAILILAHDDIEFLIHLVEYFCRDCDVFIHVDKKMRVGCLEIKRLNSLPQVKLVCQKYAVHCGGFSILKAQLFLLHEAFRLSDAQTFHVISGHDYPIKQLSAFLDFFQKNKNYNYVAFGKVNPVGFDFNSCYRYQYYFPYDYAENREQLFGKMWKWLSLQRKFHVNRGIPTNFKNLYCGSQWFSVTRETVQIILGYTKKHSGFYHRLKYTFAPEETYFLTIILNCCNPNKVVNRNLRFIRWHNENGNSPANLCKEHLHLLAETEDFFARKFVFPYCKDLITCIDKYLLKEPDQDKNECLGVKCRSLANYSYDLGLTEAIYNYCSMKPCFDVLDVGCGPGFYVAALRRLGILATGIDANPYTAELSMLLLPEGDLPCECAKIEEVDVKEKFSLVLCINVLQYIIDMETFSTALEKITALANGTLVIAWDNNLCESKQKKKLLDEILKGNNFRESKFASGYFQRLSKKISNIHVYELI